MIDRAPSVLSQRLATAAVGIPLLALVIWLGGYVLAVIVAVAVAIACIEIAAARSVAATPGALMGAVLAALLPLAAKAGDEWFGGALALAVLAPSIAFVFSPAPRVAVEPWLWSLATTFYFGLLASHFVLLRELPDGREWLFFTVLAVWAADTGAYFVGRQVGNRKLAPAISPGKTVEGAIGNQVTGFAAVFALDAILGLGLTLPERLALGFALPVIILLGDLAESALKRSLDIKDSSGLVPGHGGIADRMDSLVFAAPAVYYFLLAFVH